MSDVIHLLEAWGRWSRDECLPRGYVCGIAIIIAQNVGSTVGLAPVNEDDIDIINPIMQRLKDRKPEHYDVLKLYYKERKPTRVIAKIKHKSNGWASDTLRAGQMWVDGALSNGVLIA